MSRLLLLIPSSIGVGGAERMVDRLSRLLSSDELEVFEASFDPPDANRRYESPASFHPLGPIPRLPLPLRPIEYVLTAWRLRRLKNRLRIDVTISNLWRADLISALSGGKDKKIALCHINIIDNPTNAAMLRFRPFVAAVYRLFDRIIAVNEALAGELASLYSLPSERVGHIDNFVPHPEVVSRLPQDGVTRFVWCGRMSAEKNVGGLLLAWREFVLVRDNVQLILLGDGPQREELEASADALRLRRGAIENRAAQVVFAGFVAEPSEFILGADALLLASLNEGLPSVILEALSLGTPVLASDCPGGGVRSALLGHGVVDPDRESAEWTPCGALLPVPTAARPQSLMRWSEALARIYRDEAEVRAWREGALRRAVHFSPAAARCRWLDTLYAAR